MGPKQRLRKRPNPRKGVLSRKGFLQGRSEIRLRESGGGFEGVRYEQNFCDRLIGASQVLFG